MPERIKLILASMPWETQLHGTNQLFTYFQQIIIKKKQPESQPKPELLNCKFANC